MPFNRLAAIAGFLFAAFAMAVLFISGNQPGPDVGADEILDYLSRSQGSRDVNAVLSALGLLPLAVFVAGLLMPFRASDAAHDEGWAISILVGVIALTGSISVHEAAFFGLSYGGADGLDAGVIRGLWDVVYVTGAAAALAMAVIAGSTAVPVLSHKVWPRWHGWLSILVAALGILSLIDTVSTATAGAFSGLAFLGFTVAWTSATSILLLRESTAVDMRHGNSLSR